MNNKQHILTLLLTLSLTQTAYANIPEFGSCAENNVCTIEQSDKQLILMHKSAKKRYMDAFVCYDRKGHPFYANEAVYVPQLNEIRALDSTTKKIKPVRSIFCEYGTIIIHKNAIGIVRTNMTFTPLFELPDKNAITPCIYFDGETIDKKMSR